MAHLLGDSSYKFGFGDTSVSGIAQLLEGSADRSYAVQQDILDGSGNIVAILIGAEETKASASGYASGSATALGNSLDFFGTSGAIVTKSGQSSSNEDLQKANIEVYAITLAS